MTVYRYRLLKCEGCGKTLGYAYASAKIAYRGLVTIGYWPLQSPESHEIETFSVNAYCESCFKKKQDEVTEDKPEPEIEEDKSIEPRSKTRDRPLIR